MGAIRQDNRKAYQQQGIRVPGRSTERHKAFGGIQGRTYEGFGKHRGQAVASRVVNLDWLLELSKCPKSKLKTMKLQLDNLDTQAARRVVLCVAEKMNWNPAHALVANGLENFRTHK
jgi:hypothetical protein